MSTVAPIPFDRDAVRSHIEMLHTLADGQDGVLILAMFGENPDSGRKFKNVQRFQIGDVDQMTRAAIAFETHPDANVYAPLAVMRRDLPPNRKGEENDVNASFGAVVDSDADKGEEAHAPVEPNYIVQSSAVPAVNMQEFVLFDRPLLRAEAKPLVTALHRVSGGDPGTVDLSHVWRISGSANWPNRVKVIERNRPREPQLVRALKPWDGKRTSVDELRRVLEQHNADELGILSGGKGKTQAGDGARDYEKIIEEGIPEGEDRSAAFHAVVWHFATQGLSPEQIIDKLAQHPNGIGAKFADRLGEEVRRSYSKWRSERSVTLEDFFSLMEMHSYMCAPSRAFWPAASVNSRIPPVLLFDAQGNPVMNKKGDEQVKLTAADWLDRNKPVEQMTWCPGLPTLIHDRMVSDGGWISRPGWTIFNLYRPPTIRRGDAAFAKPWLDLVRMIYPDDAEHIIKWFAHRVQRPHEKINHALVLGGAPGIGKDTMIEPVKNAVGPWNFQEANPQIMLGRFNGFLKSVILRISEARNLGDVNRYQFYDHMKTILAAPPDVFRIDEKNLREYAIFNCVGVIVTTNHKADGIYLTADDRRHFVAWSPCKRSNFADEYWAEIWNWYDSGGYNHIAAYLAELNLSSFNPKAPPLKTAAFWEIADAGRTPEDAELADILDAMGSPEAITITAIAHAATPCGEPARGSFGEWIIDRKNRRVIPHRLETCEYVPVRNDAAKDGLWKINQKRQAVYAKVSLSVQDRIRAARRLADR